MMDAARTYPISAWWGLLGVIAIVGDAMIRLATYSYGAIVFGMNGWQWGLFFANAVFMAYAEGYRGFQLKFAPRVAARALYLRNTPVPLWVRFCAPLFCVGYFGANPRIRKIAWVGTLGVIVLVLLVQQLGQPWRGIVDVGVVIGLTWGTISMLVCGIKTFRSGEPLISPEVPAGYNQQ